MAKPVCKFKSKFDGIAKVKGYRSHNGMNLHVFVQGIVEGFCMCVGDDIDTGCGTISLRGAGPDREWGGCVWGDVKWQMTRKANGTCYNDCNAQTGKLRYENNFEVSLQGFEPGGGTGALCGECLGDPSLDTTGAIDTNKEAECWFDCMMNHYCPPDGNPCDAENLIYNTYLQDLIGDSICEDLAALMPLGVVTCGEFEEGMMVAVQAYNESFNQRSVVERAAKGELTQWLQDPSPPRMR